MSSKYITPYKRSLFKDKSLPFRHGYNIILNIKFNPNCKYILFYFNGANDDIQITRFNGCLDLVYTMACDDTYYNQPTCVFSSNNRYFMYSYTTYISIISLDLCQTMYTLDGLEYSIRDVLFNNNDRHIVVLCRNNIILVHDIECYTDIYKYEHDCPIVSVKPLLTDTRIMLLDKKSNITIVCVNKQPEHYTLADNSYIITGFMFDDFTHNLIIATNTKYIKFYNTRKHVYTKCSRVYHANCTDISYTTNRKYIVCVTHGSFSILHAATLHTLSVYDCAYSTIVYRNNIVYYTHNRTVGSSSIYTLNLSHLTNIWSYHNYSDYDHIHCYLIKTVFILFHRLIKYTHILSYDLLCSVLFYLYRDIVL